MSALVTNHGVDVVVVEIPNLSSVLHMFFHHPLSKRIIFSTSPAGSSIAAPRDHLSNKHMMLTLLKFTTSMTCFPDSVSTVRHRTK